MCSITQNSWTIHLSERNSTADPYSKRSVDNPRRLGENNISSSSGSTNEIDSDFAIISAKHAKHNCNKFAYANVIWLLSGIGD